VEKSASEHYVFINFYGHFFAYIIYLARLFETDSSQRPLKPSLISSLALKGLSMLSISKLNSVYKIDESFRVTAACVHAFQMYYIYTCFAYFLNNVLFKSTFSHKRKEKSSAKNQ